MTARPRFQTPRSPERATYGPAVGKVAAALKRPLLPWQQEWADVTGEVDSNTGRFYYDQVVMVVPRRAGKSLLTFATHLQRATTAPGLRNWATSSTESKARDAFRLSWVPNLKGSPLQQLIKVRLAMGSESLTVTANGSVISLFSPNRSGIHGDDADTVSVDEVWAFDVAQGRDVIVAIRPAQLTRPRRQTFLLSAAGDEASSWLDDLMVLGRQSVEAGERAGTAYLEYSAADALSDIDDPYDPALLEENHPALGFTVDHDAILGDAKTMDVDSYCRAYLGIRTGARVGERVLTDADWLACLDQDSQPRDNEIVMAADVAYDRTHAAIAIAGYRPDLHPHVEVIDHREGSSWLVDRLDELERTQRPFKIVVDDHGPSAGVYEECQRRRLNGLTAPRTSGVTAAAASLYDAVTEHRLRHRGQAVLDTAVSVAGRRPIGDAWTWSRRGSSGDISPLTSACFAHWALSALGVDALSASTSSEASA